MSTVTGGQGNIVTNGLVLNLDAANPRSYPQPYNGTVWSNLVPVSSSISGSLVNGPTYNTGSGGSIVFDGSNDYASCISNTTTNLTGNFTLSVWININTLPTNGNLQSLLCKYDNAPAAGGYDLRIYNNSGTMQIGLVTTNASTAGGGDVNYTFSTNIWYQIVGVYDGSFSNIYINGQYVNRVTNTINALSNTKPLNIARFGEYIGGLLTRYFNGRMAQTLIYNRALSSSEIQQNFNATRARFGV
jgi:hypothetical protein